MRSTAWRAGSLQGWLTRSGLNPTLVNGAAALIAGTRVVAQDQREFLAALRERRS